MVIDYLAPSLDTNISAISSLRAHCGPPVKVLGALRRLHDDLAGFPLPRLLPALPTLTDTGLILETGGADGQWWEATGGVLDQLRRQPDRCGAVRLPSPGRRQTKLPSGHPPRSRPWVWAVTLI
ncbi:hypothetical protein ACFY2V_17045 [Streptomyces eurythermus]|uniref:hypothetical protein n=1 Tax=Streptomyces eurythermus TaxID=42237 RepID=UPI0036C2D387